MMSGPGRDLAPRSIWRLSDLLAGFGVADLAAAPQVAISGLALDSRLVQPGWLFLACHGGQGQGLAGVDQARARGAAAIAAEPHGPWDAVTLAGLGTALGLPVIPVPDLRHQASRLAGRFLGEPSAHLQVMGVTGTHGKTCITHYLAQALASDLSCGLINPLGVGFPDDLEPARPTPLDPVSLQETLARLRARGARAVALAVSTQALAQGRTRGLHFSHAIFTQVRRDHLDCPVHLAGRGPARRGLRQVPGPAWAILNLDTALSPRLLKALDGEVRIGGYSLEAARAIPGACTLWARLHDLEPTPGGMRLDLETSAGAANLEVGLIGRRTAAAVLAVLLVLLSRGLDLERALRTLAQVRGVPGRLEPFGGHRAPWVVVDAAHTPQALTRVLLDLRTHARGRLICVFGCAGDRDAGQRPQMGAVAERLADQVLLTDDNPRREAGEAIIAQILSGMRQPARAVIEPRRGLAIRRAIATAGRDDLVLVAGRGHATRQDRGDHQVHFSDRAQVQQALAERRGGHYLEAAA
jgi:UDP-N-acetylmuramoyl-L-alanyl-D-glutamate--2,6-diaminopimelate ligase